METLTSREPKKKMRDKRLQIMIGRDIADIENTTVQTIFRIYIGMIRIQI